MQDTITKPLLKWYGDQQTDFAVEGGTGPVPGLGFRDYAPADEGGGGQAVL